MKLIQTRSDLMATMKEVSHDSLGLVATMGNLHAGHMSLLTSALETCEKVVVTIFVNPKQFGENEDLDSYPRTPEQDLILIKETAGERANDIVVFLPKDNREVYPAGFNTTVSVEGITKKLCGQSRPTHFSGVTTVVYQLFTLIKPSQAFFGQKDYQQVCVIRKMAHDLNLEIDIKTVPIKREESGLALSSRNGYLTKEEKEYALLLPNKLDELENLLIRTTWVDAQAQLNEILEETLKDTKWDYLEVLDSANLEDVESNTKEVVIAGAYFVGSKPTRLIDNRLVEITYA
ncbi:pantoate--beta-alanine ligase [Bacteriovorax sp. BAL6_X]|uniref:pantoate--beta-alanine ligase n=1 Tax=Bacteriovorax sp. BAL6_X TaxID=1201290 RepID=UPI000386B236|nr:pantoate--beta-alanine ligase [Bacteriovorax sp. BAL6_X]EPZ49408.1 pantoate--beta-alanine ligase [Bacteriovorax sp. BAL6_X]